MLHFNILHYQFLWIFHDKIQSNMHNFTLFSREIEWNLKCFHFFREMKSETNIPFTLFEKWKVKWFFVSLFSRSESEIEIPRDRDREVKFQKKSREFSRNETLAGYWFGPTPSDQDCVGNWRSVFRKIYEEWYQGDHDYMAGSPFTKVLILK